MKAGGERRIPPPLTRHSERGKCEGKRGAKNPVLPYPSFLFLPVIPPFTRHSERGKCEGKRGAKNPVNRSSALLRTTISVMITGSFVRSFDRTPSTLDDGSKKGRDYQFLISFENRVSEFHISTSSFVLCTSSF